MSGAKARELVHGTCVAFGRRAALLRGGTGAGKSDLALRFLALPPENGLAPRLVADDQVVVQVKDKGRLVASAPATIAGKIEVRGLGILAVDHVPEADLLLAVDLVKLEVVPRMPPKNAQTLSIAGVSIPLIALAPFEPSAPLKLKLALLSAAP